MNIAFIYLDIAIKTAYTVVLQRNKINKLNLNVLKLKVSSLSIGKKKSQNNMGMACEVQHES